MATIVLNSLGIVATAAIFSLQRSMSLNHATIALSLMSITMLPLHLVESWQSRSPSLYLLQQIRLFVYAALQLWLNLKTPCLGSHPSCNNCTQTVWFFFRGHLADRWTRSLHMFFIVIILQFWTQRLIWTYGPTHYFQTILAVFSQARAKEWSSYVNDTQMSLKLWRERNLRGDKKTPWISKFWLWYNDETTVASGIKANRWRHAQALGSANGRLRSLCADVRVALRVPRCQRAMIGLVFAVIWITNSEEMIRLNLTTSANDWGYGQIASMVLSAPSVASLVQLLLRVGKSRKSVIFFTRRVSIR